MRFRSKTLRDIVREKQLELALAELRQRHRREWLLERITEKKANEITSDKERHDTSQECNLILRKIKSGNFDLKCFNPDDEINYTFYQNTQPAAVHISYHDTTFYIPPNSTFLLGLIDKTIETFSKKAPKFSIITIDPPWPNRSARRKGKYNIANDTQEIRSLLLSIPITPHLTDNGLVAIWITNKPSFRTLTYELFDQWGLRVIEEWIWIKITTSGEPIFPILSLWRKPYEVLLIGRKFTAVDNSNFDMKRRILVGVPDWHSRKPHIKSLLEKTFQLNNGTYAGLEIFARNLTINWWSWGDEVLMFQDEQQWVEVIANP